MRVGQNASFDQIARRTAAIVGVWVFSGLSPPQITHTTTANKIRLPFYAISQTKILCIVSFCFATNRKYVIIFVWQKQKTKPS
jgi:hypothetical protein